MVGRVLEFGICRDVCLVIIMSHYKGKNVVHYNQDSMLHRKKGLSRPLTDDSYGAYASFPHLDHQFNTQYVFNTSLLSCRRAPSIIHNLSLATRYSCRQLQDIRASSSVFRKTTQANGKFVIAMLFLRSHHRLIVFMFQFSQSASAVEKASFQSGTSKHRWTFSELLCPSTVLNLDHHHLFFNQVEGSRNMTFGNDDFRYFEAPRILTCT